MRRLFLLLLIALPVRAELREIASSLTLDQAVGDALRDNAELHAMRARWEAAQERPAQARALPNPMLQYTAMDMANGGQWPDTGEKQVMVQQAFPWFGKRGLKGKIAEKDAEALHQDYEALRRDIVMLVKATYFDLRGTREMLTIARAETGVLERIESSTAALYATGQRSQTDILKVQVEMTMLKQKCLELETQVAALQFKINSLLNRPPEMPVGLPVTPPVSDFDLEARQLFSLANKTRPEIKKAQTELQRDEYTRRLMSKEGLPDYRLGLEYRNVGVDFTGFRRTDNMLAVTIGIDLPIWRSKYRAGIREADKMLEAGQAALEAATRQAAFDVQDAWFKLRAARQTLALYRQTLLSQAEARFKASDAAYRAGTGNFTDLLESERFQLNARALAAAAEANVGMQAARLERAVGAELLEARETK